MELATASNLAMVVGLNRVASFMNGGSIVTRGSVVTSLVVTSSMAISLMVTGLVVAILDATVRVTSTRAFEAATPSKGSSSNSPSSKKERSSP